MFAWGTSCNMVCICISMHTDTVCSLLTSIVQMFRYCLVYFPSHRVYFDIMCTDAHFINLMIICYVLLQVWIYATVCTCWWFVSPRTWSLSCFLLVTWCVNIGKKDAPPLDETCEKWSLLNTARVVVAVCEKPWCSKMMPQKNCNWPWHL